MSPPCPGRRPRQPCVRPLLPASREVRCHRLTDCFKMNQSHGKTEAAKPNTLSSPLLVPSRQLHRANVSGSAYFSYLGRFISPFRDPRPENLPSDRHSLNACTRALKPASSFRRIAS